MELRKLFHTPQFNVIDTVDQFALDWNGFTPLGAIVTQDRRASQSDVGSADILSYNNTSTVTGAATPERMALRKLFHAPQFNVIDPVDQFALDWNGFTPLGSIVTHDMLAAMEREAAKLGEKAREKLLDANDTDPAREIGKAEDAQGGISSSQETA